MYTRVIGCLLIFTPGLLGCTGNDHGSGEDRVTVYPAIESLETSSLYTVTVNGKEVWTERFVSDMDTSKLPVWFSEPYVRAPQEIHISHFSASGPLDVRVDVAAPLGEAQVKPLNRSITPRSKGSSLYFKCNGPDNLVIEVDQLPPLFIFADPPETSRPDPDSAGVRYFGPGVHSPGVMELTDNETVYLAPGAIVYGGIRADNATNIKIMGRGILDGNFEFKRMVQMENCSDITVEGVMFRYGNSWTNTLINCDRVVYDHVKVISFGPGGDGINPLNSRNFTISNSFLRCTDDCIAIKAPDTLHNVHNILIENNTMLGFAYSDGVTIGFETNADTVRDITVRNCDVLLARGGSRVDGHSGFSIICDGPSVITDILFENIRVERSEIKLFEAQVTHGKHYGDNPPGHIQNITLKDIHWAHQGPIVLKGFDDDHQVKNVQFLNCLMDDELLSEKTDKTLITNKYTDNISIKD